MSEFKQATSARATQTSVPASGTSVLLVAANPQRKQLIIVNNGTAILHILLGDAAGSAAMLTTANTLQLPTLANVILYNFTGPVSGIWSAVNGSANITELT